MLTIPGHKRNGIQTTLRFHLLLLECLPSRKKTTTNVGQDVGEKEPSYTAGGNVS
jgi:hypothetical protein